MYSKRQRQWLNYSYVAANLTVYNNTYLLVIYMKRIIHWKDITLLWWQNQANLV